MARPSAQDSEPPAEPSVENLMTQAIAFHHDGRLAEAERVYRQVIRMDPDEAAALNYLGVVLHQQGDDDDAIGVLRRSVALRPDSIDFHSNLGRVLQANGRLDESIEHYRKAASLSTNNPLTHYNLGRALFAGGAETEAESAFRQAIAIKADFVEARTELARVLLNQDRVTDAEAEFRAVVKHKPDEADAHYQLATLLAGRHEFEGAAAAYRDALSIRPDHAEALSNLGNALIELGRAEEAEESFRKALALLPENAAINHNLGNARFVQGKLREAAANYARASELAPENSDSAYSLGDVLQEIGDYEGSIEPYLRAIEAKPDFYRAYEKLEQPLALAANGGAGAEPTLQRLSSIVPRSPISGFVRYSIEALEADKGIRAHREAAKQLPGIGAETVQLRPGGQDTPRLVADRLPSRVFALVHFGRCGSGFLHSLIDGHPQVSTLPGVYMKGFFGPDVWPMLTGGPPETIVDRFVSAYEVLFDATSTRGVPGDPMGARDGYGTAEGYTAMGNDGATALKVDVDSFKDACFDLLRGRETLDQGDFFRLVHSAFEAAIGHDPAKDTIFYHIHNPTPYEFANFLKYFPEAKLLLLVREPIQNCESWTRGVMEVPCEYTSVVARLTNLLFQFDRVEFGLRESAGIRLEDLKTRPQPTLRALCKWMEIDETESLYTASMQGLKWWGEPDGATFGDGDQWSRKSIDRAVGDVLSESDQFVLRSIFLPFSRLYGYEADPESFARDLATIGPMLEQPFDFERRYFETHSRAPEELTAHGAFKYFRLALRKRWQVLDARQTYPCMVTPLSIE